MRGSERPSRKPGRIAGAGQLLAPAALERRTQPAEQLRLLHQVADATGRAISADAALDAVLALVCRSWGWTAGHVYWRRYLRLTDGRPQLVPSDRWYVTPGNDLGSFQRETRAQRFAPGEGLVGRVAATGAPVWIEALEEEPRSARPAVRAGLRSAVFVPVVAGQRLRAVLEFYAASRMRRDEHVLDTLRSVATLVGFVIERVELEKELTELADDEELRIAEELHDRVGQALTAAGLLAHGLGRRLRSRGSDETEDAAALVEAVEEAKEHVRTLARTLVPAEADAGGLRDALEKLLRRCGATSGIVCRLAAPTELPVLDQFVATQLLRIVQEALNNAVLHGGGSQLLVEVETDDQGLTVCVHDDGRGITGTADGRGGIGLRIMRHRAALIGATLAIGEGQLGGTTVTCRLPRR